MPTARILVLGVMATGLIVSCAGQGDQASDAEATDPGEELVAAGQRPPTPAPPEESSDALGPFPDPPPSDGRSATSVAPAPPVSAEQPASDLPEWWFEGVRVERGRVAMCAEATGESLLDVKRAVVEVARQALRDEFGLDGSGELPGERIERIAATPRASDGGGVAYVGYVAISIARPDED